MNALRAMGFFDGDGGVTDDGVPDALLGFDGDWAELVATNSGLGAQPGGALAVAGGVGDAGVNGELLDLVSPEPLVAFNSPHLSETGGLATRFASAHSHTAFDPAEVIRQSLWYDNAPGAPGEAAGHSAQPGDGMLGEANLTFLDTDWFAKGGNGGGNGGGGGDGTLSSYLSGDPGGYNIEIVFKKAWTVELQPAFIDS